MLMEKPVTATTLFSEIDRCLSADGQPSGFLTDVSEEPVFRKPPFDMLYALKTTEQNPRYHPEGSVWNHTMLVVDMAAYVRGSSSGPRAFMWAALLHDIGKAPTTRLRKGRLTSYDHDRVGARMAREFLLYFTADSSFIDKVCNLVRWHMQVLFAVKQPHSAGIREMSESADIRDVALLGLCDRLGRFDADREYEIKSIRGFLEQCEKMTGGDFSGLRALIGRKDILPPDRPK